MQLHQLPRSLGKVVTAVAATEKEQLTVQFMKTPQPHVRASECYRSLPCFDEA